jgi:Tfp pilus assembly protein PilW
VTSPPVTLTIFDPKPLLGLIKTATPLVYSRVGQEISYRYEVTNIGTVTLTGPFTVADDKNAVTCPADPATLAPLGVTTCVGTYVITQADIDAGSVTNIATATAVGSQLTSASVSQTVTAANRPPRPSNPIPTLGEWAQALMMVLMVLASGWYGFRTKQR